MFGAEVLQRIIGTAADIYYSEAIIETCVGLELVFGRQLDEYPIYRYVLAL